MFHPRSFSQGSGVFGLLFLMLTGCGSSDNPATTVAEETSRPAQAPDRDPLAPRPITIKSKPVVPPKSNGTGGRSGSADSGADAGSDSNGAANATAADPVPLPPRTLGDLIKGDERPFESARMAIDEQRVTDAGVLVVKGQHLHLYSDLRNLALLRELVGVFDSAVPLWCTLFGVEPDRVKDWYITGFLVQDGDRMRAAGLFPADLPPFPNGYNRGFEFWFYEQPSAFYRRYLMLHEGTHAFMQHHLGGRGAPWYSEGMAEYLAVHAWTDGQLKLKQTLDSRDAAPLWGRVKMVRDAYESENAWMPEDIMLMEDEQFLRNDSYGWAWAICHFLDRHPRYHDAFQALEPNVKDRSTGFAKPLLDGLQDVWPHVREEWQLFIGEIDYGYDVERMAIDYRAVELLDDQEHIVAVRADRGWQSTGLELKAGDSVELTASGRFLIKSGTEEWPAEPSGITIDYYRGRPLGQLIAAVRQDRDSLEMLTPLLAPVTVGSRQILQTDRDGVLFLRLNDAPNQLADNQGEASVKIRRR